MSPLDLFGSRDIPIEIAEHILYLAGPGALTNVQCTSKANAEAYKGVGLSLGKRGHWRCRVDSPDVLQFAIEHRLRCLRVVPSGFNSLRGWQATSLEWLRELCLDSDGLGSIGATPALVFPPRLAALELKNLGLVELPSLPSCDTLKRLVWCESQDGYVQPVRRTGPLPSSLVHLECNVLSYLELPELPPLLQHLDLGTSRMPTGVLPSLPATLVHLSVRRCLLTRLPDNLPLQLTYLDCRSAVLTGGLPALPATLVHLSVAHCRLTRLTLDSLPPSLVHLDCAYNCISALPALPLRLAHLDCSCNGLHVLPALPGTLVHLSCRDNSLTVAPCHLPGSLMHLNCSGVVWAEWPVLPARLVHLNCSRASLSSLPRLPLSLEVLDCSSNPSLDALPAPLPPRLRTLDCRFSSLRRLPDLPSSLSKLQCEGQLHGMAELPALHGTALHSLSCSENRLKALPAPLPRSLVSLECHTNDLTSLPALPGWLEELTCDEGLLDWLGLPPSLRKCKEVTRAGAVRLVHINRDHS